MIIKGNDLFCLDLSLLIIKRLCPQGICATVRGTNSYFEFKLVKKII
jgi:hypothetical protein